MARVDVGSMSGSESGCPIATRFRRWVSAGAGFGVAWPMQNGPRLVGTTSPRGLRTCAIPLDDGVDRVSAGTMAARARSVSRSVAIRSGSVVTDPRGARLTNRMPVPGSTAETVPGLSCRRSTRFMRRILRLSGACWKRLAFPNQLWRTRRGRVVVVHRRLPESRPRAITTCCFDRATDCGPASSSGSIRAAEQLAEELAPARPGHVRGHSPAHRPPQP